MGMTYIAAPARGELVPWQYRRTSVADTRDELWTRYLSQRHKSDRTALVESYLSLVGFVVSRLKGSLPRHVERERLSQHGVFGLIDAIERFDPARQVRFETFAVPRIRGAILDAVRAADWTPRSLRARQRALADAAGALEARLMRAPTTEEVREELGLTAAAFHALTAELSRGQLVELDEWVEQLVAVTDDPAEAFERAEETRMLRAAISSLPEREQDVLFMYYFEDRTLKEIGARLGVSESRACKLHAKAMQAVCTRLREAH
jgi:RNA polymerase sigma factor for flagellar operon FliA